MTEKKPTPTPSTEARAAKSFKGQATRKLGQDELNKLLKEAVPSMAEEPAIEEDDEEATATQKVQR